MIEKAQDEDDLMRRFPIGSRVVAKLPGPCGRARPAMVVGYGYKDDRVRICFDGTITPHTYHADFLRRTDA